MGTTCDDLKRLLQALKQLDVVDLKGEMAEKIEAFPKNKTLCSIKEALNKQYRFVDISEAEGKISADFIVPYPPGFPLIVPGEEISCEAAQVLRKTASSHEIWNFKDNKLKIF